MKIESFPTSSEIDFMEKYIQFFFFSYNHIFYQLLEIPTNYLKVSSLNLFSLQRKFKNI